MTWVVLLQCGGGVMSGLSASGYLNIVVDVLHNFTDGIAIGASFTTAGRAHTGGSPERGTDLRGCGG